ncbi:MAG TPA: hypothetical protein VFE18_14205 [Phenylobacterium sp.]|jgi:hypothetical protein|uniref:hypothetical protein n=1 Tax=Phenylobacterium sp. TaxID=1871053 RepID=UPI002D75C058|nr:hypothetical protein [Phenylobacterium sp.]HZZ69322.1 hypothetical protein [Phenylobacterium sp.]
MGTFSIVHWIVLLAVVVGYGYPIWLILRRAGFSGWWVVLWFVPLVNLAAIWFFAMARWPGQEVSQPAGT